MFGKRGTPLFGKTIWAQDNDVDDFLKALNYRSELVQLGYLAL